MNVLITGGYGFIGSHVAERFLKAGDRIYIIDNLSTGNPKNVKFKHTFFQFDVEDARCEEIFKTHRFEVVVHLAAQINAVTSMENPYLDTKSNVLGLTNMLHLSAKYGVNKFIFSSSAAVYGNTEKVNISEDIELNPVSPYGMSKLAGEIYCTKWNEVFGLNSLCLRFSNVYGPRQGTKGEGGVVSIFLEKMMQGKDLIIFGDGNQTRDFIYVKDVAEGIYRASKTRESGVFNLSTNIENSVNRLVEILASLGPVKGIQHREEREGDIINSCLDNSKIRALIDWVPLCSFEEGLKNTYNWYISRRSDYFNEKKGSNIKKNITTPMKKLLKGSPPYIENLLLFILVCFLTVLSERSSSIFIIDYKIIYIVIIAGLYGINQGILSSLLSCGLYGYVFVVKGRDVSSLINDTNSLLQITFYILIGIVLGYIIDYKNCNLNAKEMLVRSLEEKYNLISRIHDDTLRVNKELSEQIINNKESFGKACSVIKSLDSLNPIEIFDQAVSVLENMMQTNKVSIYTLTETKSIAILTAKSETVDFVVPNIVKVKERKDIQTLIHTKDVFVNKELLSYVPIMTAPIIYQDEVIAIASIHDMNFEDITLHKHNIFKSSVNLIAYSLNNAYRHTKDEHEGHVHYPRMDELG